MKQERLLEEQKLDKFQQNIIQWEFGTGPSRESISGWKAIKKTLSCGIKKPTTLIWHFLFMVWSIILVIYKFTQSAS
jgi:hypothetical protein